MFDKEKLTLSDSCIIGNTVIVKEETDSTNSDVKRNHTMNEGTVFIAETQTAGRGRTGRKWESESGLGIWMSILLKPEINLDSVSAITLVAGLSICRCLRNAGIDAYIKWPNDIVVNGKKICGILVESVIMNNKVAVAAGIGINANHTAFCNELADKATSYLLEKNEKCNREKLVESFLKEFEKDYAVFCKDGFKPLYNEYKNNCITIGKGVKVVDSDTEYEAEAIDVTEKGELVVLRNNKKTILNSGEVSVRGIYGYV